MVLRSSCAGNRLPSRQICNLTAAAMPDLHPLVEDFPSRQICNKPASVQQGLPPYRTVMDFSAPAEFRSSAIHLGGPNDIRACRGPTSVEGGHIFLPPSTPADLLCTCTAFCLRRWIAEPKVEVFIGTGTRDG